jgi:enhancing lycopene biosynthesis protein 2
MPKRVAVILSGCGRGDGSDVAEALLTLLFIERSGAEALCFAPDVESATLVDHITGETAPRGRNARVEAARITGGLPVAPLGELREEAVDALLVPGGAGPLLTLSDYIERHELCQVDDRVARLLRAMLKSRRPMGFVGVSALLAARVLGPVAGVRITLGSKATPAAKHAAVMGADVRPATAEDVILDQKARVSSTPGFLAEGARMPEVARALDRLVRGVVSAARDRSPGAPPPEGTAATGPARGSA